MKDYPTGEDLMEFVNEITFEVYLTDEVGNLLEQVGTGKISQILFSLAMDYHFPLIDVMDATHSINEMCGVLFEFNDEKDFWDKIDSYFNYQPLENYDVFFLETIEIIEKYRGNGLGERIINNMIERFYSSCGLLGLENFSNAT